MLFNFNNWNNSGKKEYDSKKKKKRKNYIHNFQQIFRPETISSNQFLYYIVHYKCNQCTKCSFIIQKHIYKGRRGRGREKKRKRDSSLRSQKIVHLNYAVSLYPRR